ncbi:protein LURP-one-related 11-like [Macadamia integrifolia]|uniref:protein LURP-one-related 11-like n=1 Tax=Macadamia integrifolia TaxID=60698 RepID=UPI001C4F7A57|nr:protein LURP-one-related 11-like [Macadamia integrifolia]
MLMAKVYPQQSPSSSTASASPSPYVTSTRETFTLWMKSLVLHGNGCTVYNSSGEIVYRIDNYHEKCSDEVYLMDLGGNVLFTIRRKKLRLFGCWEGYRCNTSRSSKEKPWFKVSKIREILKGKSSYKVTVECDQPQPRCYRIERLVSGKSEYRIVLDDSGELVAEVKQKQSTSGVSLGNDVLTMVVEPQVDHSLIMGIVTVYGLISNKM